MLSIQITEDALRYASHVPENLDRDYSPAEARTVAQMWASDETPAMLALVAGEDVSYDRLITEINERGRHWGWPNSLERLATWCINADYRGVTPDNDRGCPEKIVDGVCIHSDHTP